MNNIPVWHEIAYLYYCTPAAPAESLLKAGILVVKSVMRINNTSSFYRPLPHQFKFYAKR